MFTSTLLGDCPHGFTQATDPGVSTGPWARANYALHVGDNSQAVERNRRMLEERIGASLACVTQVHGTRCLQLHPGNLPSPRTEADGLWTCAPGLAACVLTADCLPLLLAVRDDHGHLLAVGALHAGWRGVLANILGSCWAQISRVLPRACAATSSLSIGPSICADCMEVGPEVADQFDQAGWEAGIIRGNTRPHLDLQCIVILQSQILGFGREQVETIPQCTRCTTGMYSYRANPTTGRSIAFICMPEQSSTSA